MIVALALICAVYIFAFYRTIARVKKLEEKIGFLSEELFELKERLAEERPEDDFERHFHEGLENIMNYSYASALKGDKE